MIIMESFKMMILKNSHDCDSFSRELTDIKQEQWHAGEVREATFLLQEVLYVVSSSVYFLKILFTSGTCFTLDFNHMWSLLYSIVQRSETPLAWVRPNKAEKNISQAEFWTEAKTCKWDKET